MTYPPGAAQRKAHDWRIVAPTAWGISGFVIPLLSGIVFITCGQVALLTVEKTYGLKALTTITIGQL
jgi:hypothetical protein